MVSSNVAVLGLMLVLVFVFVFVGVGDVLLGVLQLLPMPSLLP